MNPKHIGLIMDGNRRFAKSLNLKVWKGHEYGEKKVLALLDWCKEFNIKELTIYAFSVQNFNRPKQEFEYLMKLFTKFTEKILRDPKFIKSGVKIKILGNLKLFPLQLRKKIQELVNKTKNNKKYFFNIALGYGGREEIIRAVKKISTLTKKNKINTNQINQELFQKYLYLESEPDMIIRTGGDYRTSNFLPWQSIYSEWFFINKKWPEFEKQDFINCLNEFSKRQRRFGK